MNEYDLTILKKIVSFVTILQAVNISILGFFITGKMLSLETIIIILGVVILGFVCFFIIEKIRKEYNHSIEGLLDQITTIDTVKLSAAITPQGTVKAPRWSVIQYRGYDDFSYGSFDTYVTDKEIIIRGRLKRGQQSLYMRIVKPWK
jgi:hypothetical protein